MMETSQEREGLELADRGVESDLEYLPARD